MNFYKFNKLFHEWTDDHISYCVYSKEEIDPANIETITLQSNEWVASFSSGVTSTRKRSEEGVTYDHEGFKVRPILLNNDSGFPCKILSSNKEEETFNVMLFQKKQSENVEHVLVKITNMPEKFLVFRPRLFKGDTTSKDAFRHEIEIPDENFPELWKDLAPRK